MLGLSCLYGFIYLILSGTIPRGLLKLCCTQGVFYCTYLQYCLKSTFDYGITSHGICFAIILHIYMLAYLWNLSRGCVCPCSPVYKDTAVCPYICSKFFYNHLAAY